MTGLTLSVQYARYDVGMIVLVKCAEGDACLGAEGMRKHAPVTPGELLLEEFLVPLGLSRYRLAKEIGVPAQRISEIMAGKRAISADSDLRLCRFFGLSNGYWLLAQAAYDEESARSAVMQCAGSIEGKDPERAENARVIVRARIVSHHGR